MCQSGSWGKLRWYAQIGQFQKSLVEELLTKASGNHKGQCRTWARNSRMSRQQFEFFGGCRQLVTIAQGKDSKCPEPFFLLWSFLGAPPCLDPTRSQREARVWIQPLCNPPVQSNRFRYFIPQVGSLGIVLDFFLFFSLSFHHSQWWHLTVSEFLLCARTVLRTLHALCQLQSYVEPLFNWWATEA